MATLWFCYSRGTYDLDGPEPPHSPYTIYYHLGRFLRDRAVELGMDFQYRNLDELTQDTIGAEDIVIGHTWFAPEGGWMHQALNSDCRRVFILQPYSHGMVSDGDVPRVLDLWHRAAHLFLITGEFWHFTMSGSPYAALKPKSTRLDMAINPEQHPFLKTSWNKSGRRGWLCIGNDVPAKGFAYIAELARTAGVRLGHYGSASPATFQHVPQMTLHGGRLFDVAAITDICQQYDFFISLAPMDANPTTLLETAAWGLIGFSNRESGYLPDKPFLELKLGDMAFNLHQLRTWQHMDEYELRQRNRDMRETIEKQYSWQRFCDRVWNEVRDYL